jgi:Flp pilus assembly protein TadB
VSKERAQRRAEREAEAAARAAEAQQAAQRQARRDARKRALTRWLPKPRKRADGIIARRHQTRSALAVVAVFVLNVMVWLGSGDWAVRFLALGLSLLITPIVLILLTS